MNSKIQFLHLRWISFLVIQTFLFGTLAIDLSWALAPRSKIPTEYELAHIGFGAEGEKNKEKPLLKNEDKTHTPKNLNNVSVDKALDARIKGFFDRSFFKKHLITIIVLISVFVISLVLLLVGALVPGLPANVILGLIIVGFILLAIVILTIIVRMLQAKVGNSVLGKVRFGIVAVITLSLFVLAGVGFAGLVFTSLTWPIVLVIMSLIFTYLSYRLYPSEKDNGGDKNDEKESLPKEEEVVTSFGANDDIPGLDKTQEKQEKKKKVLEETKRKELDKKILKETKRKEREKKVLEETKRKELEKKVLEETKRKELEKKVLEETKRKEREKKEREKKAREKTKREDLEETGIAGDPIRSDPRTLSQNQANIYRDARGLFQEPMQRSNGLGFFNSNYDSGTGYVLGNPSQEELKNLYPSNNSLDNLKGLYSDYLSGPPFSSLQTVEPSRNTRNLKGDLQTRSVVGSVEQEKLSSLSTTAAYRSHWGISPDVKLFEDKPVPLEVLLAAKDWKAPKELSLSLQKVLKGYSIKVVSTLDTDVKNIIEEKMILVSQSFAKYVEDEWSNGGQVGMEMRLYNEIWELTHPENRRMDEEERAIFQANAWTYAMSQMNLSKIQKIASFERKWFEYVKSIDNRYNVKQLDGFEVLVKLHEELVAKVENQDRWEVLKLTTLSPVDSIDKKLSDYILSKFESARSA